MLTDFEGYSQRIIDRVHRPKHLDSKDEMLEFIDSGKPGLFSFNIALKDNQNVVIFGLLDKNQPECPIVGIKYWCDFEGIKTGFLDAFVEQLLGRNEREIEVMTIKEVENFLRDDNSVPSLPNYGTIFFPIFNKVKDGLKNAISEARGRRVGVQASPTIADDYRPSETPIFNVEEHGPFTELTIEKKNRFVFQVIDRHIRPFLYRDYGDIECLFIDGSMIVVQYSGNCSSCTKSLTSTMDYIQEVLRLELKDPSILVVTDS